MIVIANLLTFVLLVAHLKTSLQNEVTDYPEKSLQCHSFLTKPDMKLICPAARSVLLLLCAFCLIMKFATRNKFCVKEVSTMQSDTCGDSEFYFGDMYVHKSGECQFKKCSDECVEETIEFTYAYLSYHRTRYCCHTDLCNDAATFRRISLVLLPIVFAAAFALM
jgi:hypothetical protein